MFSGSLSRLLWRLRPDAAATLLYSPAQMRAVLDRQRARCDRNNHGFSLLVFGWSSAAPPDAIRALTDALRKRTRATDELGWIDVHRVGAVLETATSAIAWKIADDIMAACPAHLPYLTTEVFSYPSDGSQSRPDRPGRRIPRLFSPVEAPPPSRHAGGERTGEGDRPVQRMERLFARPLPLWKRALDIAGALLGLVLLAPIMVLAAMATKLASRGPAIFKQQRVGLGGECFTMYKLRTMDVDADARKADLLAHSERDGPFKMVNDPRLTPVGRFLRQSSIDELPQLWNVLKGDMSLVGPRPLPAHEMVACAPWQQQRLDVTPGLTCIWQVSGRSEIPFVQWVRMDLQYIRSRSLLQDVKLLLRTIPAVVGGKGAY